MISLSGSHLGRPADVLREKQQLTNDFDVLLLTPIFLLTISNLFGLNAGINISCILLHPGIA